VVVVGDDNLEVSAPPGALTPELLTCLRAAKPYLLPLLRDDPVFVDTETRSIVKLRSVGSRAYALHPSTEVLCVVALWKDLAFEWTVGDPPPTALHDAVLRGVPIVAHNGLGFDRYIWERLGWPPGRWIDSMQLARLLGLPASLEGLATRILGAGKDIEGKKLTLALSQVDRKTGVLRPLGEELLTRVRRYCRRDTELLRDLWHSVLANGRDLEIAIREVDTRINDRGFLLDAKLAEAIIHCDGEIRNVRSSAAALSDE
jgi:DNA polymerase